MTKKETQVDVFLYDDYRKFLRDWYLKAKRTRRDVTYRALSQKGGFGSPNFFKRIMDGIRNLSHESAVVVARILKLNQRETDYFINLVHYNQATAHDEKNEFYQKILQSQRFSKLNPLAKDQYEYCAHWYLPVLRELATSRDFKDNWEQIGQSLSPALTPREVEKSVETLQRLGFIKRNGRGCWVLSEPIVTTGPVAQDVSVVNYHREVLDIVREKLVEVPEEQRDVSALTLGVTYEMIPKLKEMIRDFRREVLKFVIQDPRTDDVMLLTIQFVPVTQVKKKDEE